MMKAFKKRGALTHFQILSEISKQDPHLKQKDLAKKLGITIQAVSENIKTLKIYTIEKELTTSWDINTITNKITDTITTLEKKAYTPKNYSFIITNKNEITTSVKINNIKTSLINENKLQTIINDIINNNKTNILTENNITYEYLN